MQLRLVSFVCALLTSLCACATTATHVVDDDGTIHLVNVDEHGRAVLGYDVVAYWTDAKPVPGSEQFQSRYRGAKYCFASEEHKRAFDADPAKYEPNFGGYCGYAASIDKLSPISPDFWEIIDGRLVLQHNQKAWDLWHEDVPQNLRKADANWPGLVARNAPQQRTSRDPLALYPENYRILFENEHVRVLDFRLARGASERVHEHPRHVAVFLTDVKIRFTLPTGEKRLREAHAGDVAYSEPTAHASENIGFADAHGILIELKDQAGATLDAPVLIDADARRIKSGPGEITAVTLVHGIAGKEADLEEHLLSLAAPTRAEAGCRRYDLYRSTVNPQEFMRLEVWESLAALEAHKQTPHLRASFEKRTREGWTTEIMTFQSAE